jgi:hypothetical protein
MAWQDVAAIILAVGVAAAVVLLSLGAESRAKEISMADAELLSTVLGAAVGALAAFLGGRRRD